MNNVVIMFLTLAVSVSLAVFLSAPLGVCVHQGDPFEAVFPICEP